MIHGFRIAHILYIWYNILYLCAYYEWSVVIFMNYNKKSIAAKQKELTASGRRMMSKASVISLRITLVLFVTVMVCGIMASLGVLRGIIDTAPSIDTIDVSPEGYSTKIYDSQGNLTQTLIGQNANRIYVPLSEIPDVVQNAFIAIEDERFREHDGIDVRGILRAAQNTLTHGDLSQGASTITQQLLKNTVFNGGSEKSDLAKIQRKIQEQYLAIQLEQVLDKNTILEYYLNTINLSQNTLGVQAASLRYFGKKVSELTLSESSVIAGITQNPSAYNPITHPEDNNTKRSIVLDYMREQGYIDEAQYNEAMADNVYDRIAKHNEGYSSSQNESVSSYFNDALYEQVMKDLKEDLGYTETQAYNALYRGGLSIYSTQDKDLQNICDTITNDPSYYPSNSEFQLSYQLTINNPDGSQSNYNEQTLKAWYLKKNAAFDIYFTDKKLARSYVKKYRKHILKKGGEIAGENLNFILQPQVSFVLMDQHTGQVQALVGGRGKKLATRTLNRATDSLRQPGSTFKIVSTYLPAFDTAGMTLSSTEVDEKYFYPGTNKEVRNWNRSSFRGKTTLRQAIIDSMNVIAVKTLEKVTPKVAYDYLLNLGFTTLVDSRTDKNGKTFSDIQLPMALGGLTDGVTNIELTAAYASIANMGVYTEPVLYTKIVDHDGNVLIEKKPETRQVFKDTTAYLLTEAMQDVVTKGTGKPARFTAIDMPEAGKTGTTSNDIDLWFEGFTPYYTAGIWGGWDLNKNQADTTYHKTIWKTIMEQVHSFKQLERTDFEVPESAKQTYICTSCGKLATDACKAAGAVKKEIFTDNNAPTEYCTCHSQKKNNTTAETTDSTNSTDSSTSDTKKSDNTSQKVTNKSEKTPSDVEAKVNKTDKASDEETKVDDNSDSESYDVEASVNTAEE